MEENTMKKSIVSIACSCILLGTTAINTFANDFLYVSDGDTTVSHIKKNQTSLTAATTVQGDFLVVEDKETMVARLTGQNHLITHVSNPKGDSMTGVIDTVTGAQAVQITTAGDETPITLVSPAQ